MLKNLKMSLVDYVNSLTIYDYIAFGWLIFLLFILLLLSVLLFRKKPKLASFLLFIVFITMFTGPVFTKIFLDKTVRKVEIVDQNHTLLNFSKSLIVTGKLYNKSKIDFYICHVSAKVLKVSDNKYKNIINSIKPIRKKSIIIDVNISKNEYKEFKMIFEEFKYKNNYNVITVAECY